MFISLELNLVFIWGSHSIRTTEIRQFGVSLSPCLGCLQSLLRLHPVLCLGHLSIWWSTRGPLRSCQERRREVFCLLEGTPPQPRRNGPLAWNTSLPESSLLVLDLYPCMGISFPVSYSKCMSLFCLSVCVIWYLVNPVTLSIHCREGLGPFILQHKSSGLYEGLWCCIGCQEGLAGCDGPTATSEADLTLPLYVTLFPPVFDCVVLSLVTPIPRRSGQECLDFSSW